jgi:hypothetical protein
VLPNRIICSGTCTSKSLFSCETDDGKSPILAFHHPSPGVYKIDFDPAVLTEPVVVLATSKGVAGTVATDASAFVRHADQKGCEIVTAVFDRATNTLITQDSDFFYTIIELSGAGFQTAATR